MREEDKKKINDYSKKTELYLSRRKFDDKGAITQVTCSRCKEFKNLNEFSKNKRGIDGIDHKCKSCKVNYRIA